MTHEDLIDKVAELLLEFVDRGVAQDILAAPYAMKVIRLVKGMKPAKENSMMSRGHDRYGDRLICQTCSQYIAPAEIVPGNPGRVSYPDFVPVVAPQACHNNTVRHGGRPGDVGGYIETGMFCGPVQPETEQERLIRWLGYSS